ncbi:MAG: AbrB/MazE/SpoVT family DNA-binding domain-containing protein [Promethearchaeota archaeon]
MTWTFRKLQKISGSYLVSLPKNWIKTIGLDKNSTIGISIQDNGTLVISPKSDQVEFKDELTMTSSSYVPREVIKNLFSGIEKIILVSEKTISQKLKKEIKRLITDLPNIEIVEDKPQRIVIQNFGFKKVPTNKIIERLLYILSDIFTNVKNNSINELEENVVLLRRFYFLLVIHIRTFLRTGIYDLKIKDLTPLKAIDYRSFSEQIEHIGYKLQYFRLSEKTKDFFEKVESYYNEVMNAYFNKDLKIAYKLWLDKDELEEEARKLMDVLDYEDKDRIKDLWMIIRHCKRMAALI